MCYGTFVANRFLASIRLVLDACARDGVRVALIGGFALPFHGIQRATGDVDFLVEARAADTLDRTLLDAGLRRLHRSDETANYAADVSTLTGIDLLFARRPPTIAMLERAATYPVATGAVSVPVVDIEGLIGLKLQALVNDPRRRLRDQDDIEALVHRHVAHLDEALLREYFALFDMTDVLDSLLADARRRP